MEYILSKKTHDFLARLDKRHLFTTIGDALPRQYLCVTSWSQALAIYLDAATSIASIEARNHLVNQLPKSLYRRWNDIANAIGPVLDSVLDQKVEAALCAGQIPQELHDKRHYGIYWNFSHYIFEIEYADYIKTHHFASIVQLYMRGHFPCGWVGEFPQGRLAVY